MWINYIGEPDFLNDKRNDTDCYTIGETITIVLDKKEVDKEIGLDKTEKKERNIFRKLFRRRKK